MHQIDWTAFEEALFNYAVKEIEVFAGEHPDEQFYGFMFDCDSYYGYVLLCFNTQAELDRKLKLEEKCGILTDPEEWRWGCGDWKYMDVGTKDECPWSTPWLSFEQLMIEAQDWEQPADDEDSDGEEEGQSDLDADVRGRRFMEAVCRALVRLEIAGTFKQFSRTSDFAILAADHDERDEQSIFRFLKIRTALLADLPGQIRRELCIRGNLKSMARGYFALAAEHFLRDDYAAMADRVLDAIACDPALQGSQLYPFPASTQQTSITFEQAAGHALAAHAELVSARAPQEQWDFLKRAIEFDPQCAQHHFQLGYLLVCMSITTKETSIGELAGVEYQTAINLDKSQPIFFVERSQWQEMYRRKPDLTAAIHDISKALELRPNHFYWHLTRARLLEKGERWGEALEDYDTAKRLIQSAGNDRQVSRDFLLNRADCLAELGENAAARDEYTILLNDDRLSRQKADILRRRAKMHELLGDLTGAAADAHAADAIKPE